MFKKLIQKAELQLNIEDIQNCDTSFDIYNLSIAASDLECVATASDYISDLELEIFDNNDNYLDTAIINTQYEVELRILIDLTDMEIKSFTPLLVMSHNFSTASKYKEAAVKTFEQIIKDYYDSSSTYNSADLEVTVKSGHTFYEVQ